MKRVAETIFRGVFGLFYLAIGLYWIYLVSKGQGGFPGFNEAEKALTSAMNNASFFQPAVIFSCVAGGALTLFYRTAPAGIIVLTPLIVMIFLYHAYLTQAYIHSSAQLLWLLALYWIYRRSFLPRVNNRWQSAA